jgi:hypothetical protein
MSTDGKVRVRVSSGATYEDGLKLFDEYKLEYRNSLPETKYKWLLYIGILLWVVDSPSIILKLLKKFRPRVR